MSGICVLRGILDGELFELCEIKGLFYPCKRMKHVSFGKIVGHSRSGDKNGGRNKVVLPDLFDHLDSVNARHIDI
jgi:hypothetical protein